MNCPRLAHVVRHGEAAVVADQDVIGVVRVDPDRVDVVVRRERGVRARTCWPPSIVICMPTPPM